MRNLFATTAIATVHPIPTYWTVDWDVAIIIKALEELYPMRAEHKHLTVGYRWESLVNESRSTAEIK